jgi:hypothetical protein
MSPGAVAGNGQVGRRFLSTPVESGRIQYPRDAGIVDRGILILMIKKKTFFFFVPGSSDSSDAPGTKKTVGGNQPI